MFNFFNSEKVVYSIFHFRNKTMAAIAAPLEMPVQGFSFENCKRNAFLAGNGFKAPKMTKTGTTICAVVFKDGVVLGADTRSTGGDMVADKNCEKLHYVAPNMYCAGAGTAADCDKTTKNISSQVIKWRFIVSL